jgi:beta-1,2-mannobiose phosphorylase / 1,2-beta-oligomannan phosphorylase
VKYKEKYKYDDPNLEYMLRIEKDGLLLKKEQFKPCDKRFEVIGVFNPAALRLKDGRIVLYVRIAERLKETSRGKYVCVPRSVGDKNYNIVIDKIKRSFVDSSDRGGFHFKDHTVRLKFISHFRRVFLSKDGFGVEKIEQKPCFYGIKSDGELGVEDPRITKIGNRYIMTYVALSHYNSISSSYAVSKDGISWDRRGIIFRHQNKDVVLFPKKISGKYVAFNRPEGNFNFSAPHMWISYSKDLEHWGDDRSVLLSKDSWDSARVGAGCPPILTKKGWLELYHGVHSKYGYGMGAALFDKKIPHKLIARGPCDVPLLYATKTYEKRGWMPKVVFPTGLIEEGDKILLYSGGADEVVTVKEIELNEIFNHLKRKYI